MPEYPSGLLDLTAPRALSVICETLIAEAHSAWAQLDDPDASEALHDLRVSIRRLRSVLRAFRVQLSHTIPKKLRRQFRDLQRATNPAREAEVQVAWIGARRQRCTRGQWIGARWLLQRLQEARDTGYAVSADAVASKFPRLERRLQKRLDEAAAILETHGPAEVTFAAVCADLIRDHTASLEEELASVTEPTKEAETHSARICAKRLRYLLELVERDVAPARGAVEALKSLQDLLGDLHDAQVADEELAEASETAATEHVRRLHELEAHEPDKRARRRALRKNAVPGLLALARMRQEERERLFAEFEREWGDGRHEKLRENVDQVLVELGRHRALTAVEIERKYLLSGLPSASADARSVEVEQGWLPGTRLLERIRRVCSAGEEAYFRTMKLGTGLVRTEIEEETTKEVFDQLWPLTEGKRVRKRRYYVPNDDLIWELDEFLDRELVLAEIELPSADTEVRLPEWLQPVLVREVTGEPEYVNVNLAR